VLATSDHGFIELSPDRAITITQSEANRHAHARGFGLLPLREAFYTGRHGGCRER
jgi:hypothetical protein